MKRPFKRMFVIVTCMQTINQNTAVPCAFGRWLSWGLKLVQRHTDFDQGAERIAFIEVLIDF